jgi:hypothetical protein
MFLAPSPTLLCAISPIRMQAGIRLALSELSVNISLPMFSPYPLSFSKGCN